MINYHEFVWMWHRQQRKANCVGKDIKATNPTEYLGYSEASDRLNSVDFIKGFGIISFILWHSYDYMYETTILRPPLGRFILYTTGIFIFMSGFIVGYHYYQKYLKTSNVDRHTINKKLYIRAMKLIFYVFIANLTYNITITKSISVHTLIKTISSIMSLFYTHRWDIPLQVLIVIACGLILSPLILKSIIKYNEITIKILIFIISIICLYDFLHRGKIPYLWRYLPLSITGIIFGRKINNNKNWRWFGDYQIIYLTCSLLLCLTAAILPSWFNYILMETGPYLILIISVYLSLNIIASKFIEQQCIVPQIISRGLIFMGQYSLLIYFIQVITLNTISKLIGGRRFETSTNIIIISIIVLIISIIVAYITSKFRKYYYGDKIYRLLFL